MNRGSEVFAGSFLILVIFSSLCLFKIAMAKKYEKEIAYKSYVKETLHKHQMEMISLKLQIKKLNERTLEKCGTLNRN